MKRYCLLNIYSVFINVKKINEYAIKIFTTFSLITEIRN